MTAAEAAVKNTLADWAGTQREEAVMVKQYLTLDREVFRRVDPERNYTVAPEGLKLHYDDWGETQVMRGKYEEAIRFTEHYVPIVRHLPQL